MSRNGWGQPACPPAILMSAKDKPAIPPHGDSTGGFQDVISVHESSYHMEEEKKIKKNEKKKII